jgi:hypothetical protein
MNGRTGRGLRKRNWVNRMEKPDADVIAAAGELLMR